MKTGADFLSRFEMDPNEKIIQKIKEGNPTKPSEPVFFDATD